MHIYMIETTYTQAAIGVLQKQLLSARLGRKACVDVRRKNLRRWACEAAEHRRVAVLV